MHKRIRFCIVLWSAAFRCTMVFPCLSVGWDLTQAASIFGRVPCPPHNDHSSPTGDPITETLFQVIGFQQHMRALWRFTGRCSFACRFASHPLRFLLRLGPVRRLELPQCTGMVMVTLEAGPPTAGGWILTPWQRHTERCHSEPGSPSSTNEMASRSLSASQTEVRSYGRG